MSYFPQNSVILAKKDIFSHMIVLIHPWWQGIWGPYKEGTHFSHSLLLSVESHCGGDWVDGRRRPPRVEQITSTHKECASVGSIRSPQGFSYTPGFSRLLIILFQSFSLPEKHRRASLLLLSWLARKSLHCLISCVVGVSNSSLTVTLRL